MASTLDQNPEGALVPTLSYSAHQAREVVAGLDGFSRKFAEVREIQSRLVKQQYVLENIIREVHDILGKMRALLIRNGRPHEAIDRRVAEIRTERDASLLEDYLELNRFYQEVGHVLEAERNEAGITDNQLKKAEKGILLEMQLGPYIMKHFGAEINELLSKSYNRSTHNALKQKVFHKITKGDDLDEQQKLFYASRVRNVFDSLALLDGEKGSLSLSKNAVYGMVGRVLSEDQLHNIFNGDLSVLRELPPGRIKVSFPDRSIDYYHDELEEVPADIEKLVNAPIPLHILMVHYRTDEDLKKLLMDMSNGETLKGECCEGSGCIEVKGISGNDDVVIHDLPENVSKEDFLAAPAKYMRHDVQFEVL